MFYPRFHSDLDILMQSSIYGVSGVSSSYILYSNILLGKILTVFVSILPNVPWYMVFHYVLIFISLFVITYITVKRNKSVTGKVLAAVTVAFIGYECYVEPNYMKTSVLLCVSAAYLLYKGEKIIMVSITGEQVDRDSTIHYITLWPNDEVKIYDFGCDTKVEDVVEKLGQPDQITEDELMLDYWYRYNDACLYMSFNSKSKVLEYVNFDLASNNK